MFTTEMSSLILVKGWEEIDTWDLQEHPEGLAVQIRIPKNRSFTGWFWWVVVFYLFSPR